MSRNSKYEKPISERVWNASQSWWFERIERVVVGGQVHMLKTTICHNAYAEQSYAEIKRWDGAKWATVHHIDGVQLKLYSYVNRTAPDIEKVFGTDAAELMRVAKAVIR